MRSKMRRACCAFTRLISIGRGASNALRMAPRVISSNSTRFAFNGSTPKSSAKCQAIASPSRSKSVANQISLAFLASFFSAVTCARRSSLTS